MIFFPLIIFFVQYAGADYLNHDFIIEPEIKVIRDDQVDRPLKTVCALMKYDYFEEMKKLRQLKAHMDLAVQMPLTDQQRELIKKLKEELSQTTDRLVYLAKPEWNDEILTFNLWWWFPPEYNTEDIDIESVEATALYYKGEPAGYLAPKLLRHAQSVTFPNNETRFYFSFKARGTYLEVCQFISTLEFEVRIKYRWYHSAFCPRVTDPDVQLAFQIGNSTPALQRYLACQSRPPSEKMFFLKGRAP